MLFSKYFFIIACSVMIISSCKVEKKIKKNPPKHFFCSIEEVINNHQTKWLFNNKGISSAIYSFPKDSVPKLKINFSPSCSISYPFEIKENKILVKWINQPINDSIHHIMSIIKKYNQHYHAKTFMRISLLNDTTLKINYPHENFRNTLNAGSNERILFPNKIYILNRESSKNINYHLIKE